MIINQLEEKSSNDYRLYISFFEVYNEKIFDLFSNKGFKDMNGLEIRETKNGDVQIPELISFEINNLE